MLPHTNLILWKQPFLFHSCDRIRLIGSIINTALMANQPTVQEWLTLPRTRAAVPLTSNWFSLATIISTLFWNMRLNYTLKWFWVFLLSFDTRVFSSAWMRLFELTVRFNCWQNKRRFLTSQDYIILSDTTSLVEMLQPGALFFFRDVRYFETPPPPLHVSISSECMYNTYSHTQLQYDHFKPSKHTHTPSNNVEIS